MGEGLKRAFAATAMTRMTEQQKLVFGVLTQDWMTADQIADATGIKGYSPREIVSKAANSLTKNHVIEKGGTRQKPVWRRLPSKG